MAIVKSVTDKSAAPATFQEVKHWHETNLHPSVIDFNDPKPYEVYSEGRWAGIFQCLVGETQVKLSDGSTVRLDEVNVGNRVISYDECYIISTVVATYDQGIRPCVELTFNCGESVTCTEDHRFLTGRGWRRVSEMFIGETLLSHKNITVHLTGVKPIGLRNVYDIEVEGSHCFIANDLIAHNCTGQGAQKLFQRCKPKSIIDIAALTSIYRPGPLAAKVDKLWQKHETEPYDWGHPLINDVLKDARGLLIFQEHVMSLANKVSGFPMEQCDEVRRAIMKRSISGGAEAVKKTKELEESIVNGAIKNGVPKDTAKKMYETITFMSGYGFNRCLKFSVTINTYSNTGEFVTTKQIADVTPGDIVRSRNEETMEDVYLPVQAKHDHGKLELVEVELTTGEKIQCTMNHKFRTVETGEMLPLWLIQKKNMSIVVDSVTKSTTTK